MQPAELASDGKNHAQNNHPSREQLEKFRCSPHLSSSMRWRDAPSMRIGRVQSFSISRAKCCRRPPHLRSGRTHRDRRVSLWSALATRLRLLRWYRACCARTNSLPSLPVLLVKARNMCARQQKCPTPDAFRLLLWRRTGLNQVRKSAAGSLAGAPDSLQKQLNLISVHARNLIVDCRALSTAFVLVENKL